MATTNDDSIKLLAQCLKDYDKQTGQLTAMVKPKVKTKDHAPVSVWEWFSTPAAAFKGWQK